MSDAKKTAIGEVIELRKSILKGYELNFGFYKAKVAAGDYKEEKYRITYELAGQLGATLSDHTGLEIWEEAELESGRQSTKWIIEAYFNIAN